MAYWVIEDGIKCDKCDGKGETVIQDFVTKNPLKLMCVACYGKGTIERRVKLEDALKALASENPGARKERDAITSNLLPYAQALKKLSNELK